MANFKRDILEAVGDEPIEAILIHGPLNSIYIDDDPRDNGIICGKPLSAEQALAMLDYEFDDGFGGQDCHNITVWTAANVYYVHEYDGSISLESVQRNPPATQEPDHD